MIKLNFLLLLLFSLPLLAGQCYAEDKDPGDGQGYAAEDLPYVEIEHIQDLAAVSQEARDSGKIIMLEMSASYCSYCRTLEEHIIKPMLRSGDYTQQVLIRKLEIDAHYPMKLASGKSISPAQLASQLKISVTPTLIFLDGEGREVSERILGVNSLDFYGAFVDDALEKGYQSIQNKL